MRWLTCLALVVAALGRECNAADVIRIDEQYRHIEAGPLSADRWASIETDLLSKAPQLLTVHVGQPASYNSRPVLGTYTRAGDRLRFVPRFAFQPGLSYVARLVVSPASNGNDADIHWLTFSRPAELTTERQRVDAVYPSSSQLPANLLKFYLHFSGPMSRGEAYRRIRLVDDDGEVDLPFLELGEELWDPDGRRLTLLFDPGRIKRGLKPREDAGQILIPGKRYALQIDAGWPDARGNALTENYQKRFVVTAPDYVQPDLSKWRLRVPPGRTREPLVVTFTESMDHAMARRVITVLGPSGNAIGGTVTLSQQETQWALRPDQVWSSGDHRLVVDAALEDVAGNSLGRPFEVENEAAAREARFEQRLFTIADGSVERSH